MLVSFSVQNYRSFASRQTISMAAGSGAKRKNRFSMASGNSLAPSVLRSVCLFGPNGAGKSSLVRAFDFFHDFVISSAKDTQAGEKIEVFPFKLDNNWRKQPTELEATFIHGDALYQYGFAVDANRVWSEWLFSKPNSPDTKTRTLFQREYDSEEGSYSWNISKSYVRGERELWKKSTRDNALFLSTAIQLKADIFQEPFDWIQKCLRVVESPDRLSPGFTAHQCMEEEGWKEKVLDILKAVDIRIKDIGVETTKFDPDDFPTDIFSKSEVEEIKKSLSGAKRLQIRSFHQSMGEELVPLDFFDEESDGSKVVFNAAGPWLDVLNNGYTLIIDELHNSLHPHALKFLVNLFHDPKINRKNAQLIYTSHETSVLSKDFMHQDQVWLVEKDDYEASKLIPLSDFRVRDVSSFQKAYLNGRYGAVPKLGDFVNG